MNKDIERKILLNPGPATTTDTVKMAQVVPDICPREEEFSELMAGIRDDLLKIVNVDKKKYTTVLFGGSGTAVMESVIASVVNQEKTLLILKNGAYGDRMQKIVETYSIPFTTLEYEWGKPINFSEVDSYLKSNLEIGYIAMVHHETTSGILNSIENFSELGKNYGHTLILDAISSYAGISIDLKKTPIDFLMSTSNKCIQGMAGLAFSICKKSELKHLKDIPNRSFYLSLYDQYNYMEKTGQMRFTPPVQTIYALRQAIDELQRETVASRYSRYSQSWRTLIDGMDKLGFQQYVPFDYQSKLICTFYEPDNFDFNDFHNFLYDRNITIYPGKVLNENTFRIGTIGDINSNDIEYLLKCIKEYLSECAEEKVK